MAKKTNKTSHVMNLLTNGASPETEAAASPAAETSASPESPAAGQDKKGDVQSHTVTPKKVTVVDEGSRNDRLSQEILTKLSEELEEEQNMENKTPEMIPENYTETQADPASAAQAVQAEQESAQSVPAAQTESKTSPAAEEPSASPATQAETPSPAEASAEQPEPGKTPETPAQEPAPAAAEEEPIQLSGKTAHHTIIPNGNIEGNMIEGKYRFVNIMEHLMLRQDISSYMDQYNVCKCPRCMADVCALALTGLPAKYVVTNKDSLSPLLSYYESRNKIVILTALIKACNKVRENPRHKRPQ